LLAVRVGRRLLSPEHLHVADVVDVELRLQDYYQSLPVQPHGQDRRAEGHFAYRGVPLPIVSISGSKLGSPQLTLVF